jgi:hypothetical protein
MVGGWILMDSRGGWEGIEFVLLGALDWTVLILMLSSEQTYCS